MFFDQYYIYLVIPAVLIAMLAQFNVSSTFSKYAKVFSSRNLTAADVARRILDQNSLSYVRIERIGGNLTDHFDPRTNVIRLSDSVYNSTSVASIGVAAHEVGHAIQHATDYTPIRLRGAILPVANLGSTLAVPIAIVGLFAGLEWLTTAGILLFCGVVLFQLVTLPVEFNASNRALKTLDNDMILVDDELKGAKKVLTAAALTYVAALLVSLANLVRLILLNNRRND